MKIKTTQDILNGVLKDNVLGLKFEINNKDKWVKVDDYLSFLNRIKSPTVDFLCECTDHSGICAMCAVKKMIKEEMKEGK